MFNLLASTRMDMAIAENESSVPVIHKTTRVSLLICTLSFSCVDFASHQALIFFRPWMPSETVTMSEISQRVPDA